jgi:predicted nuclease of predicted toxin-antitoxin system
VFHRLRHYGHDVVHVDRSEDLEKGDADDALAAFSREREFVIVTYDDDFRDDFRDDFSGSEYRAVLYIPDQTLAAEQIADALHEISTYYGQDELDGFLTVGRSWL